MGVVWVVIRRPPSADEDVRLAETLRLAHREVGSERTGAVGDRVDVAVLVEVEVHAVHLEPDLGVVLDAGQGVHGSGRLVKEGARPVDVVVLLVFPGTRGRVAVHRAGVPVGLHLEARLEDVLHDPQPVGLVDLDHLELVSAADLDERQIVLADVYGGRCCAHRLSGHGAAPPGRGCTSSQKLSPQTLDMQEARSNSELRGSGSAQEAASSCPSTGLRGAGAIGRAPYVSSASISW